MRWVSDLRSAERGEITILALLETLFSVSIYVGIAIWCQTFNHILIAAAFTPLWLFRTKKSVRRALRYYDKYMDHDTVIEWFASQSEKLTENLSRYGTEAKSLQELFQQPRSPEVLRRACRMLIGILFDLVYIILVLVITTLLKMLVALFVRIVATVVSIIRNPLVHFAAIRKNWKRIVLATDCGALPEWLPGIENARNKSKVTQDGETTASPRYAFAAGIVVEVARRSRGLQNRTSAFVIYSIFALPLLLVYGLPLVFRFAIKGSTILYSPFFLVITPDPINRYLDLPTRLEEIQHDNSSFVKRCVGFFLIACFLSTLFMGGLFQKALTWPLSEGTPVFTLFASYFIPPTLKFWQLVSAINSVIFFYLSWIYAPRAVVRLRNGSLSRLHVRMILDRVIGIQMVLSTYSTLCGIAIVANFVLHHEFPKRRWEWFPAVDFQSALVAAPSKPIQPSLPTDD